MSLSCGERRTEIDSEEGSAMQWKEREIEGADDFTILTKGNENIFSLLSLLYCCLANTSSENTCGDLRFSSENGENISVVMEIVTFAQSPRIMMSIDD